MEEISATIPEYQLLQVLWHSLHSTNHPFPHDLLITQELVPISTLILM